MKALVDQRSFITDYLGTSGMRICEKVEDNAVFEVHPNLIWIDCPDDLNIDMHYYLNGVITAIPVNPNPPSDEPTP